MSRYAKSNQLSRGATIGIIVFDLLVLLALAGLLAKCAYNNHMRSSGKAYPPLHMAALKGDLTEVKRLIAEGTPIDQGDYFGKTALEDAVCMMTGFNETHAAVALYLLDEGANIEGRTLNCAVSWENEAILQKIVDKGGKAWSGDFANYIWGHADSDRGVNYNIADLLLTAGADINSRGSYVLSYHGNNVEFTSLGYAVYYRNYDLVRYLVDKGADVNLAMENGETPLELSATDQRFTGGGSGNAPGVNYYYYAREDPMITMYLVSHGAH
jgi:ankyrin repeat protein